MAARPHLLLGRWQLRLDGQRGVLDIYNLPEPYRANRPRNYSAGTLFMADGRALRVNGQIDANALTLHIDGARPNLPPSELCGTPITLWMRVPESRWMAGVVRGKNGAAFPVVALKVSAAASKTALVHPVKPLQGVLGIEP